VTLRRIFSEVIGSFLNSLLLNSSSQFFLVLLLDSSPQFFFSILLLNPRSTRLRSTRLDSASASERTNLDAIADAERRRRLRPYRRDERRVGVVRHGVVGRGALDEIALEPQAHTERALAR
jgi:hypothetical protein